MPVTWRRVIVGGPIGSIRRLPRYAIVLIIFSALIWAPVAGYVLFYPKAYTSRFTLLLPNSGISNVVKIDSIGQSSSSAVSPYGVSSLSPTKNYKRILISRRLRTLAAAKLQMAPHTFPVPKVKLVLQTHIINVSITGRTPDVAQRNARALLSVFQGELRRLRKDELAQREKSYRSAISDYEHSVGTASTNLTELQASAGVFSLAQFKERASKLSELASAIPTLAAETAQIHAEMTSLETYLGISAPLASAALKLRNDAVFQETYQAYAKQAATLAKTTQTLGAHHPRRLAAQRMMHSAAQQLRQRIRQVVGPNLTHTSEFADLSASHERAEQLARLVSLATKHQGLKSRLTAMRQHQAQESRQLRTLLPVAVRLEDLERNRKVAEAVFTSAIARIDTKKTDFYASYPLVQVFEHPDLPGAPSAPLVVLPIILGLLASICSIAGLSLLWLRSGIIAFLLGLIGGSRYQAENTAGWPDISYPAR